MIKDEKREKNPIQQTIYYAYNTGGTMNIRMSWILNYIPSWSNRSDKYARKQ